MASRVFSLLRAVVVCAAFPLLLLAPGEARAQGSNAPCGALNAGNSFAADCSSATYATGIAYWDQANGVTLTVPGTATTATVTANNGFQQLDNGITIRTNAHASQARNISLTVGGTGTAVAIVQGSSPSATSWNNNRGILVFQRTGNGSTTTLDIKSGVTIGTATTKMASRGIEVTSDSGAPATGAGAVSVTSAATVYSVDDGITVVQPGTGAVTVANSGAITTDGRGIYVNAEGSAGAVTVANSGAITSADTTNSEGIFAETTGKDSASGNAGVSITHSAGAISVTSGGVGIKAYVGEARDEDNAMGGSYQAPMNAGLAKVSVTGGSVSSKDNAIEARNYEAGSVEVETSAGVTLTSLEGNGIEASLTDVGNAAGQIKITQGGRILGRTGVYAQVAHSATAETVPRRAETEQPLIDIAWTGTFGAGTTAETAPDDTGRFAATSLDRAAVVAHRGAVVEEVTRYGQAAGIEAQIMSIGDVASFVAKGDDPREFTNNPVTQRVLLDFNLLSGETAAPGAKDRQKEIVSQFRELVRSDFTSIDDRNMIDTDNDEKYSDLEILAWLNEDSADRRTFLHNLLTQGLSEGEEMILKELTTGGDLGDLDELFRKLPPYADAPNTWYTERWKDTVKAFLQRRNAGNIRVKVNAGNISSRGDGIRAYFTTPHDANGAIAVTIAEGASVEGVMAGVYVANAGKGLRIEKKYAPKDVQDENRNLGDDDLVAVPRHLNQVVRVDGTVTGGTDAAVHLAGGGALIVGLTGKLVAGPSGLAVKVNDPGPAIIVIAASRNPREQQPVVTRPIANVAMNRGLGKAGLIEGGQNTIVYFLEYLDGMETGRRSERVPVVDGRPDTSRLRGADLEDLQDPEGDGGPGDSGSGGPGDSGNGNPPADPFSCDWTGDGRCRLYEALPSILLAMNAPATRDERLAAARGTNGVWTRIHLSGGKSKVESSTRPDVAYDRHRNGVRAGVETAVADGLRIGGSVHGFRGVATLPDGNEAKLSSAGAGAYVTALADGFHWDMQATATRYEADLRSAVHRRPALASDVSGTGYALSVEVGRRMAAAKFSVTPRVGIAWSRVALDDFADSVTSTAVSVERAESLAGRVGASMEASLGEDGRAFAALDVRHAFSTDMETVVEKEALKTTIKRTSVRFGLGGSFDLDDAASLRVSAGYVAGGGSNRELEGALDLTFRF